MSADSLKRALTLRLSHNARTVQLVEEAVDSVTVVVGYQIGFHRDDGSGVAWTSAIYSQDTAQGHADMGHPVRALYATDPSNA